MLVSMLLIVTEPAKTMAQLTATAAKSRLVRALRRPRFCSATLISNQRGSNAGRYNVHERVCFMCANSVGTITQSWCPSRTRKDADQTVSFGLDHRDSARQPLESR